MQDSYFYSKSTKLYISRKPLLIDSRVKAAAKQINLNLNWTDTGWINYIDFADAKKLLSSLDSCMLSPVDYWLVYRDALEDGDMNMVEELCSGEYCEWLDRVYLRDGNYIDHPKLEGDTQYAGDRCKTVSPIGRPGWFSPENNINYSTGEPINVSNVREKSSNTWKYWSPDHSVTKLNALAPIRGYVTSVGKPSFDAGIPVDSRQPLQIVRECKHHPVEINIPIALQTEVANLLEPYEKLVQNLYNENSMQNHMNNGPKLEEFSKTSGHYFAKSKELYAYKTREKIFNSLGLYRAQIAYDGTKANYEDFEKYIKQSHDRLKTALEASTDIVFVMGHKNPDTDAIISAAFEAYRNNILDGDTTTYIPVVQYYRIPEEVAALLGESVSDALILTNDPLYIKAKESGLARWISVDQNLEADVQKYFISIVDHHVPSDFANKVDLPKTLEWVGSSTSLVAQKLFGMGLTPDTKLATILYGATLMDTENRVEHKMTLKDVVIMDYLKLLAKVMDDKVLYGGLMSHLLSSEDADILFKRDYKQDWGFGFAVVKVTHGFNILPRLLELNEKNTLEKNLPLTILRVTEYADDSITVNRETIYCSFNPDCTNEFKNTIWKLLRTIITFEFPDTHISQTDSYIEFWGTGLQLSRKKTAPIVEVVVRAFNEYFYSKRINKWVKRTFLTDTTNTKHAAESLNLSLTTDSHHRINHITYSEAKSLGVELGFDMLSLPELWAVIDDATEKNDFQMMDSLQGSNFVEFTDTVLTRVGDKRYQYNHPTILGTDIKGACDEIDLPNGNPGLIRPENIDRKTGLPTKVRPPNEYGQKGLWRYWQPDADLVLVTRSFIFLLQQPCWDGKFHLQDSLPNLGIRPCYKNHPIPQVTIIKDNEKLEVSIYSEGDSLDYVWHKRI